LSIFVLGILVYLNGRSNPLTTTETDYQAIPYQYFSLFNGVFLLTTLWHELREDIEKNKRILYAGMFFFLGIYFMFLFLLFVDKWADKTYHKYMGTQALIYDRPTVDP